jgi:hypothetical protein
MLVREPGAVMSHSSIVRSLVVTLGLSVSGAAFAGPPSRAAIIPIQEQAMKGAGAKQSRLAPGYRDTFLRFGVRSPLTMRPRAAR